MGSVIQFPPKLDCPLCAVPLRPASRRELNEDLNNPKYRQLALSAAQGAQDWEPPEEFAEWQKEISPPGSWLFRCDRRGNRIFGAKTRLSSARDVEALFEDPRGPTT